MNIREFVHNLQELYEEMGKTFTAFQSSTGLNCPPSCGRCCTNPDIEASVFEMIPMAFKITELGLTEKWLEMLADAEKKPCLAFVSLGPDGQGKCSMYETRPSVCRMFGVAGYYDKNEKITLSICKHLKTQNENSLPPIESSKAPVLRDWAARLMQLHPQIIQERKPLNQALRIALEKVALLLDYESVKY